MELDLKARLDAQGVVLGTFIQDIRSPFVIQLAAAAELDFVIIDTEHGVLNTETVADLIKMARALGVIPIVRVIAPTYEVMCPRLDAGARGLLLPRISGAEAVRQAVRCTKYPPEGIRGMVTLKGQTDYVVPDFPVHLKLQNRSNFVIPQIELVAALENLDDILAVEGVDVVLAGPCDLSVALGWPGEFSHPEQVRHIERVVEACNRHGVAPGIAVGNAASGAEWIEKGMRFVCCGGDAFILRSGFDEIAKLRSK